MGEFSLRSPAKAGEFAALYNVIYIILLVDALCRDGPKITCIEKCLPTQRTQGFHELTELIEVDSSYIVCL